MFRRRRLAVVVPLLAAALAGCGNGDGDAVHRAVVVVKTFSFQPDPLEVDAGTVITFENQDKINHSVTAGTRAKPAPNDFDGVMDGAGTTFELTLDEPGTYDYFCKFHPGEGMTGQIVVR